MKHSNSQEERKQKTGRLGTFAGVFTPSVLTILGIILFLRLGYVVGAAGTAGALVIIAMANIISVLTTFSLSAVATNLKVKGGGDYYLISRTLGLEFGGAIGIVLFLAQAVSVAFYCIGFGEAVAASAVFSAYGISPQLIAAAAVAFLFVFAWMGADWATRFQYVVMVLLGAIGCLGVMLALDLFTGILAVSILFAVFQYLRRTADPARWADSRRAHHLQRVRENLLAANVSPEHPRDWRPQILAFSEDPIRRPRLLRMAGWFEGGSGLTAVVTVLEGKDLMLSPKKKDTESQMLRDIRDHNPAAFPLVLTTRDSEVAFHALLQAHGIGPLRANTILLNWFDSKNEPGMGFRAFLFGRQLKTVYQLGCNIAMLHAEPAAWDHLMAADSSQSRIDVWWSNDPTGNLMLLFAYLMTRSDDWDVLRILVFRDNSPQADQKKAVAEVLTDARINAEIVFAASKDAAAIIEASARSTLVFLPFRFHGNLIQLPAGGTAEDLLKKLPPTVMFLAAEDIDLGAEPEEGVAAELAEARDLLEKKMQLAETAEKEAEEAGRAAGTAEENLKKALSGSDRDKDRITALTADRDTAAETLEKARRRAARARAKAELSRQAFEDEAMRSKIKTNDKSA